MQEANDLEYQSDEWGRLASLNHQQEIEHQYFLEYSPEGENDGK